MMVRVDQAVLFYVVSAWVLGWLEAPKWPYSHGRQLVWVGTHWASHPGLWFSFVWPLHGAWASHHVAARLQEQFYLFLSPSS